MLFLFDCDLTLYTYDFRKRLPALARIGGTSQYRLAHLWWAEGYERRAEAGEWPDAHEYIDAFCRVTGATLTLEQWAVARASAMTPIAGSLEAVAVAGGYGTTGLLSNNPSAFGATFEQLAPEAADLLGPNVLVSAGLGVRKPDVRIFERALDHFGESPDTTFFADDVAENAAAAASLGITAHHFTGDTGALLAAVRQFGEAT